MKMVKMTVKKAKQYGFTHKGFIYGFIRIYANYYEGCSEPQIIARNNFYEIMLDLFIFIDSFGGQKEYSKMYLIEIDEKEPINWSNTIIWIFIMLLITWIALKLRG